MTIRNLDRVFAPRSVAVVGASDRPGSVGRTVMENLASARFTGRVMPVNPRHASVCGIAAFKDVASLPETPDLAVIAIPAAHVPAVVRDLAARGTAGAVVISAGFDAPLEPGGQDGRGVQAMLDAARPALLRIVGPNTLGIVVPSIGLNASFAHLTPQSGSIAFLAQSGAIATSVLDWAHARGIGFSHVVSLGDMADVDFGDMLDYLANDRATRAVLLYVEAITHARKFMSAARAAARTKPVLVVKGGRHARSAGAAASHTGRLAGPDAEYAAAFRRAGMLRVATLDELFDAVETLALARPPRGPRLAIVSNGGGLGVLAADALLDRGGELAALAPQTLAALDAFLPPAWSRGNPIDIVGDADAQRYAQALDVVLGDPSSDAVLVLHCPTAMDSGVDSARMVARAAAARPGATVLTSWLGDFSARAARGEFQAAKVPTYDTPEHAVRAFMQMVDYRRNQELLLETPPSLPESFVTDFTAARREIETARAERRPWLTHAESRRVLAAYGIPVAPWQQAATPADAATAAERIGGRVALKIVSPDVVHKSEVGGVVLGLAAAEVADAAQAMLQRVAAQYPQAVVHGFAVEAMVDKTDALELIVGASAGSDFGPVILFGEGGTAVEVTADTAVELPPLNLRLARRLIERTRVYRRMRGYRSFPPVDIDAVALALTRVSQLLVDFPEILEIDVNPLLARPSGVLALDARMKVSLDAELPPSRLAIRPYPKELERVVEARDGTRFLLRPIRPEDEPALRAGFGRLTPEEIHHRFFVPMKDLPHLAAARFTQIDYDREMAFVLASTAAGGTPVLHGVVRLAADPDNARAEFAIVVERAYAGRGLGRALMTNMIEYARSRGIGEIFGDVLKDNVAMLSLCRSLGFTVMPDESDTGAVRVRLPLRDSQRRE